MSDPMGNERGHSPDAHDCPARDCSAGFDQLGNLLKHIHDAHESQVFALLDG